MIDYLRTRIGKFAVLAVLGLPGLALAQADRPLKMILPNGPGSGIDAIARSIAPSLSKALGGQAVVIENQPGGGGISGTQALIKSAPDGNTISIISNNHVIYPSVIKSLPFDPITDITPIAVLGTTPLLLVVNSAKVPAKNARELVAFLKSKPGMTNYASSGNGTILHFASAMFVDEANVDVRHIPYKGVGPMLADTIGGQVEFAVSALAPVQGHLKTGTLRAIGMTGAARSAAAPEIPTFVEQGMSGYVVEAWFGVIAPKGLPPEQVRRLHAAFVAALAMPEAQDAMAKQGNAVRVTSPEAAGQYLKSEVEKYATLVKKAGVKLD